MTKGKELPVNCRWSLVSPIWLLFGICAWHLLLPTGSAAEFADNNREGKLIAVDSSVPTETEWKEVTALLSSGQWPHRAFGIMRLERYKSTFLEEALIKATADKKPVVRCFALQVALRIGCKPALAFLSEEESPLVIRAAVEAGVSLSSDQIESILNKLRKSKDINDRLIAIDIALAIKDSTFRKAARKILSSIIHNMKSPQDIMFGNRLLVYTYSKRPITDVKSWQRWLRDQDANFLLQPRKAIAVSKEGRPALATVGLSCDDFSFLSSYLGELSHKWVQMAVVMDATASMGHSIRELQGQVDRLVLVMNGLAERMSFGVVAYRDLHDFNVVESHSLTSNIDDVRKFLYKIEALGGGDQPESVLAGMQRAKTFKWEEDALKIIFIIGDAQSQPKEKKKLLRLVEKMLEKSITVNTVAASGSSDRCRKDFTDIANKANGRAVIRDSNVELAKQILRLSLDEKVRPAFDDFYEWYTHFVF